MQSQQVHQLTEENVSIHSHQSVDEHYEEMVQYAETHKMYEEQRAKQRFVLMIFCPMEFLVLLDFYSKTVSTCTSYNTIFKAAKQS